MLRYQRRCGGTLPHTSLQGQPVRSFRMSAIVGFVCKTRLTSMDAGDGLFVLSALWLFVRAELQVQLDSG